VLEAPQLVDGRGLAGDELLLLLDVERLLLGGDREVLLEALQLRTGALELVAPLAQLVLRAAGPLLGQDARVVGAAQLLLDRLQLRGDAAGARLRRPEVRFEIGELPLQREHAGRGAFETAADDQRPADN